MSWRILTKPESLLAKILLGKYCHSSYFLDSKTPSSCSHRWRGICIGIDLLQSHLGKVIGDGHSTNLWEVPWLSLSSPLALMGPPTEATQCLKVSHLISPVTLEWDREKITQLLPELEDDILEIRLSSLGAKDYHAWLPTKDGCYNIKSGYFTSLKRVQLIEEISQGVIIRPHQGFDWTRDIWNIKSSPKTKFFLWKLMRGAVPLGKNLKARHINDSAMCTFCALEESSLHLFFQCPFAKQIWNVAPFKNTLSVDHISSLRAGIKASKLLICLPPSGLAAGPLLPWIVWAIWVARNQKIFNNKISSPMETLTHAISLAREWQSA